MVIVFETVNPFMPKGNYIPVFLATFLFHLSLFDFCHVELKSSLIPSSNTSSISDPLLMYLDLGLTLLLGSVSSFL